MKIKDYMKTDFRAVSAGTPLREIARLFFETGESVLPVTEEDGKLIGVISIDDFLLIFLPEYIDLIKDIDFIHDFGALDQPGPRIATRYDNVHVLGTAGQRADDRGPVNHLVLDEVG